MSCRSRWTPQRSVCGRASHDSYCRSGEAQGKGGPSLSTVHRPDGRCYRDGLFLVPAVWTVCPDPTQDAAYVRPGRTEQVSDDLAPALDAAMGAIRVERDKAATELADLERRSRELRRTVADLDTVLDRVATVGQPRKEGGKIGRPPGPSTWPPTGYHAVREVLSQYPGQAFSAREILELLNERGWGPDSVDPYNAVSSSCTRAHERFPEIVVEKGHGPGRPNRFRFEGQEA